MHESPFEPDTLSSADAQKKHVLSFRVSEAEWRSLQAVSREAGADISSLLRQGLRLLLVDRRD